MSKRPSFSSYVKWLESQVAHFHIHRKSLPFKPLELIKDTRYDLVPLHKRPDLLQDCCRLLNAEWKRSREARLASLRISCDKFPTCLLLLNEENQLLGHCKVSRVQHTKDSIVVESLIIDQARRFQGLGSMLLRAVENYVRQKGITNVYLMTKGQEQFYEKNGYVTCDPMQELLGFSDYISESIANSENTNCDNQPENKEVISAGPPPPPMPELPKPPVQINLAISCKTFMKKHLETCLN